MQADPDVLLVMTRGLESVGGIDGLLALPGVSSTRAAAARAVIAVDDDLLLSFGPRTGASSLGSRNSSTPTAATHDRSTTHQPQRRRRLSRGVARAHDAVVARQRRVPDFVARPARHHRRRTSPRRLRLGGAQRVLAGASAAGGARRRGRREPRGRRRDHAGNLPQPARRTRDRRSLCWCRSRSGDCDHRRSEPTAARCAGGRISRRHAVDRARLRVVAQRRQDRGRHADSHGHRINAFAGAVIGLAVFVADDDEIRSVTFWSLGTLGSQHGSRLPQ